MRPVLGVFAPRAQGKFSAPVLVTFPVELFFKGNRLLILPAVKPRPWNTRRCSCSCWCFSNFWKGFFFAKRTRLRCHWWISNYNGFLLSVTNKFAKKCQKRFDQNCDFLPPYLYLSKDLKIQFFPWKTPRCATWLWTLRTLCWRTLRSVGTTFCSSAGIQTIGKTKTGIAFPTPELMLFFTGFADSRAAGGSCSPWKIPAWTRQGQSGGSGSSRTPEAQPGTWKNYFLNNIYTLDFFRKEKTQLYLTIRCYAMLCHVNEHSYFWFWYHLKGNNIIACLWEKKFQNPYIYVVFWYNCIFFWKLRKEINFFCFWARSRWW